MSRISEPLTTAARITRRYSSPVLATAGGLCLGEAIRGAVHHGHLWAFLAAAVIMWAASFALLYVSYRARRRELLRKRAVLLWMMGELDDIAAHGLLAGGHRDDVLNYEHFDCCGQGMVPKAEG